MRPVETLITDIRFAVRTLRRDRSFTCAALFILALGIAANTAVFSLVNGILLRPLAYDRPGQLLVINEVAHYGAEVESLPVNARHFLAWKRNCQAFQDIALMDGAEVNLSGAAEPERVRAARVTPNYFDVLGIAPRAGRTFMPDDGQPGRDDLVVLGYSLWQRRFGGDPALVGARIDINGVSRMVVGVLPASFRQPAWKSMGRDLTGAEEVFLPWAIREDDWGMLGDFNYYAIGRLADHNSPAQAESEINVIQYQIASSLTGADQIDLKARVSPLQATITDKARGGLLLLLAAVGALLLIVCVNLASLILSHTFGRSHDTAIRTALGASRWRIFQSILSESVLLALAGAGLGLAASIAIIKLLVQSAPPGLPRLQDVDIDYRVLLFTLAVAVAAGLLVGLLPAWRLTRADPHKSMLASGRRATGSGAKQRLQSGLVAAEVGLSVTLLVVAGLLVTSFARLISVDRGFEVQNILTAQVNLASPAYKDSARREQFYNALISGLDNQAGVVASGVVSVLPLNGERWNDVITLAGDTRPIMERPTAAYRPVSSDYLRAMGIRLIAGRTAAESDRPRHVVVVSERTAQLLWPGQNPIGKTFKRGNPDEPPHQVIGVAAGIRDKTLEQEPGLIVYVPLWERVPSTASIVVRTAADPRSAAGALGQAVRSLDPGLPVSEVQTMEQIERGSLSQREFQMLLIVLFAGSALLLSAVGVYSVLAAAVARRTAEIGVRIALGAQSSAIMSMVFARGLWPVAIGVAAGIAGALIIGRFVSSLLFAVSPYDVKTITAVIALTLVAAICACWLPARRAIRIDPIDALRYE